MWAWSKVVGKPNDDGFTFTQVTALAVDPSGSRVVAIASDIRLEQANVFILDASTGAQASQRRKL